MKTSQKNNFIWKWLENPLTREISLDDPKLTNLRRQNIFMNRFLHEVYCLWYRYIAASLPKRNFLLLEIGSGAGFLEEYVPNLIQSDILPIAGNTICLNALHLSFHASTFQSILMTNVLHHIPNTRQFFNEADRILIPGGMIVMVEPWVTP
jgi:SAM-dependent methyltransferase